MKSLFNNPWFIAGLGVFAVVYLAITTIMPMLTEEPMVAGEVETFGVEDYATTNPALVAGRQKTQSRDDIGWLHNINRDPFSGTLLAEKELGRATLPKVDALFVGAGVQAAVVNNRLVRVGDVVDQYQVTQIKDKHVQVIRDGRTYRLEPEV